MMMKSSVEGKPRSTTTSRKGKGKGKGKGKKAASLSSSSSWPWPDDNHHHHPFPLLLLPSSTTQWHDLPREVWQIIFINHLSILDQISFRLVCKYWYKVSCSTRLESLPLEYQQQAAQCPSQSPWLMLVKPWLWYDLKDQVSPEFVEFSTGRVYNMKDYIPDLFKPNSRVLKSAYGWLLVLQRLDYDNYKEDPECAVSPGHQPLFFLNPFTRARIDIHIPTGSSIGESFLEDLADNADPQCAFSAPPTQKDCILFVNIRTCYNYRKFKIATFLHSSRRRRRHTSPHGDDGGGTPAPPGDFRYYCWTINQFIAGDGKSVVQLPFGNPVRNVVYWDGIFYCVHGKGYISSYNVSRSKEWVMLGRPKMLPPKQQNLHMISYLVQKPSPVGVKSSSSSSISRAFLCIGMCREPKPDHASYIKYFIELLDGQTLKQRLYKRKETPKIDQLPTFKELKPFKSKIANELYRSKHLLFQPPSHEEAIRRSRREVRLDSFSRFAWMCNFDQHDDDNNNNSSSSIGSGAVDVDEAGEQDDKPRQICYRRKLAYEPSYIGQKKATQILWIEPTWVNPSSSALLHGSS